MIKKDRLAQTFKDLVSIDSVSKNEEAVSCEIRKILESIGAETMIDNAGENTGSNTGNLIVRFGGNTLDKGAQTDSILFSAHMDTVEPGKGITPVLKDGTFISKGPTILGADDKSAIAILLEAMRTIHENNLPHGPVEIVFTVCEEIGLLGSKNLDYSLITAKYGYALDTEDTEGIVTRAPAANRIEFKIHGKEAHAGVEPEKGINAIVLAGKAVAGLDTGRIDHETTCNIGLIEGGMATNIVPGLVTIKGEVRSHNKEKLGKITNKIVSSFKEAVEKSGKDSPDGCIPYVDINIEKEFSLTNVPDNHPVVLLAQKAAENLGKKIVTRTTGGGSDANIFFEKGIMTGVLGTGMHDIHTVRESIKLDDMVKTTRLLLEIIRLHSRGQGSGVGDQRAGQPLNR